MCCRRRQPKSSVLSSSMCFCLWAVVFGPHGRVDCGCCTGCACAGERNCSCCRPLPGGGRHLQPPLAAVLAAQQTGRRRHPHRAAQLPAAPGRRRWDGIPGNSLPCGLVVGCPGQVTPASLPACKRLRYCLLSCCFEAFCAGYRCPACCMHCRTLRPLATATCALHTTHCVLHCLLPAAAAQALCSSESAWSWRA